jgi:hypothetical protein
MTSHYLLACSISADVRQSVQIKFDDLKLPKSVIETLEKNNTVSLRPNLSNSLKGELDALRVMQRELYDRYCIHFGDYHFVTSNYFERANELIKEIRSAGEAANSRLKDLWRDEFDAWSQTAHGILRPLFEENDEFELAHDAYLRLFPTAEEYKKPIRVSVLGPLPVSLTKVDKPIVEDLEALMAYENQINTEQVLEAARNSAADRALQIGAELLDDLDVRSITKIGKQQTGGERKRGSWQLTAEKLKLISDSVPGFDQLTTLANQLLQAGNDIQSEDRSVRQAGAKDFYKVQESIREELEMICETRDESKGLEKLKKSLALSSQYKTLCDRIKGAENVNSLNLLVRDANIELDVYAQRSKQLKKLINQRRELIGTAGEKLDELLVELSATVPVIEEAAIDIPQEADF